MTSEGEMSEAERLEALLFCRALGRVEAATREALAAHGKARALVANEELVNWSSQPTSLYLVTAGEVLLTSGTRGGGSPSTRTLRRGALLCVGSVSQQHPFPVMARALRASTVLEFPIVEVRSLTKASPALAEAFTDLAMIRDCEREIVAALTRSALGAAVNKRRLHERLDEADVEHFNNGDALVRQGETAAGAFFLIEGTLEALRREADVEVLVDTVHAGEVLCDLALATSVPEPLTLRARGPVTIVRIPSLADRRVGSTRAASTALTVDLRALVGPKPETVLTGVGSMMVQQLRAAHGDAVVLVRPRFETTRSSQSSGDVLEVTLPSDERAGEVLEEFLARYNGTHAMALLDTTGLEKREGEWLSRAVRAVVHFAESPDDEVRFPSMHAIDDVHVGLVHGAAHKPWAPAMLRLSASALTVRAETSFERAPASLREAVARITRAFTGRRVGVALGGGGAWGYAHVSLLRGMRAIEVPVDVLAGCSFGAVVGAYYAAFGGTDEGLRRCLAVGSRLSNSVLRSFFSSEAVSRLVDEDLVSHYIESLELPFFPVATEIATGTQRTIRQGPLSRGVRASGAFPALFTPVTDSGPHLKQASRLVDGGIINNVPEDVPSREGAHLVIASNIVSAPMRMPAPTPRFNLRVGEVEVGRLLHEFNPYERMRDLMRSFLVLMHSAGSADSHLADVTFSPPVPKSFPWDFAHPQAVMDNAVGALGDPEAVMKNAARVRQGDASANVPGDLARIKTRWDELARPLKPQG